MNCRKTDGSLEYVGKKDKSEKRKPCIPAQNMIPAIFAEEEERRRWFEAKYGYKLFIIHYFILLVIISILVWNNLK